MTCRQIRVDLSIMFGTDIIGRRACRVLFYVPILRIIFSLCIFPFALPTVLEFGPIVFI